MLAANATCYQCVLVEDEGYDPNYDGCVAGGAYDSMAACLWHDFLTYNEYDMSANSLQFASVVT